MFDKYREDIGIALRTIDPGPIGQAVKILQRAMGRKSAVYIVGNGGSAATSSHFANDLVKACGIRAYSLPDMVPAATAFGNDHRWEEMYSRLLKGLLSPSDVLVAISCSGNSPNIVDVFTMAKHYPWMQRIALIGSDPDCMLAIEKPNALISVPFRDIKIQEDCHMIICHAIVGALKDAPTPTKGIL